MRARGMLMLSAVTAIVSGSSIAEAQIDALTGQQGTSAVSQPVQATNDGRQDVQIRVESISIPFKTVYELSRTVGQGRIVKQVAGKPGEIRTTYEVKFVNGKPVSKVKTGSEVVPAVNETFLIGRTGYSSSRGHFERGKVLTMKASAYDPSAGRGFRATFRTATGERAKYGVVAVDPRVIPLGTMLFIEGYGFARASDTGGAIKGNRIDLCLNSRAECLQFGRRLVRVHVLK